MWVGEVGGEVWTRVMNGKIGDEKGVIEGKDGADVRAGCPFRGVEEWLVVRFWGWMAYKKDTLCYK